MLFCIAPENSASFSISRCALKINEATSAIRSAIILELFELALGLSQGALEIRECVGLLDWQILGVQVPMMAARP